jgi:hypothetical protein
MPERDQLDHDRLRSAQPGKDQPGKDGAASLPIGRAVPQGLSWSWELDFETLMAALNEPAPWNRPPRKPAAAGGAAAGTSAPGAATDSAATDSAAAPGSAATDSAAAAVAANAAAVAANAAAVAANAAAANAAANAAAVAANAGEPEDQDAVLDALLAAEVREVPIGVAAGRVAECLPAGPGLAGWLASADAADLEDVALAGVAASWRRVASWAQAGELAAVAQIASRSAARDPKIAVAADGRPERIPDEAAAQVSLGLVMSGYNAGWWLDLAVTLAWRLAATGAALAAGVIDLSRARLIAEATSVLSDENARAVEAQILPRAGELTNAGLRAALRRAVIAADPDGAERRRKESEARAKLCLYPDEDGTATLAGYSLPGIGAAAAMARISALARALKASGAGGGIDLLRAQVFLGLLCGTLPLIPPADGAPPDTPPPADDNPSPADPPPGDGPPGDGPPPAGPPHDAAPEEEVPPPDSPPPGDDPPPDEPPGGPDPGPGADPDKQWWRAGEPAPVPDWPPLPARVPAAFTASAPAASRPAAGLLDLTLPWATLAGLSHEPGRLGRLGPITPSQACQLAGHAAADPGTDWRIILTNPAGQALAVTRIPRTRARSAPPRDGPLITWTGLVSRVTLTIPQDILTTTPDYQPGQAAGILDRALRAAATAAEHAARRAAAGGCAHTTATPRYRPPPRLKEYIAARDLTCRFPPCRQPAWRGDLDHTRPYDDGGLTCRCNLGGFCRHHHILKHHPDWQVTQISPGTFQWTTPTGRTYTTTPDTHPI